MPNDSVLCTYPPHLRGFVYARREASWRGGQHTVHYWGVKNWDTGQIIARDNTGCTLARAMDEVAVMVLAARGAWVWELSQGMLKRKGESSWL